jgi:hypothetical protein
MTEITNNERAARALLALVEHNRHTGHAIDVTGTEELATVIVDLLADLRHLTHGYALQWDALVTSADRHFYAELEEVNHD